MTGQAHAVDCQQVLEFVIARYPNVKSKRVHGHASWCRCDYVHQKKALLRGSLDILVKLGKSAFQVPRLRSKIGARKKPRTALKPNYLMHYSECTSVDWFFRDRKLKPRFDQDFSKILWNFKTSISVSVSALPHFIIPLANKFQYFKSFKILLPKKPYIFHFGLKINYCLFLNFLNPRLLRSQNQPKEPNSPFLCLVDDWAILM